MFTGSMVAIATPMHADGSVDYKSYDRLIDFHLQNNTDALVPVGTTGESATLDHDEHCKVVRFVVEKIANRIPVIAGTGANSTLEAVTLTQFAHKAGADACLLVTPYYNKPTQEGLYQHYKKVAESVPIPLIPYNVPSRTACDMLPETIERFLTINNIVAVKEAIGDLSRIKKLVDICGDKINILSGDDITSMESLLLGGKGVITVTGNIAPKLMHLMCKAAIDGDRSLANSYNEKLLGLHENLFLESNPIPAKWALCKMGLIEKGIRLPLTWFSEIHHEKLLKAMELAEVK
ncbi:MAG: 4-hydroxy-tetrahydrodipicolinate synthase [Gammaproteobacteria bacterium]|jgi:4-hydroxy-tetrahydrodipicolinate synthase|nr:4-hydroxy-tetrahydrodipicolinate synthase [Gammaproteobacteria bacterium]MBT7603078.1 4-hydroxy-tetrahydrodipicolinate synthase [Gammaproteobacteria bacterium]